MADTQTKPTAPVAKQPENGSAAATPATLSVLKGTTSVYAPEGTKEGYTVDWGNIPLASIKYALETALSKMIGNSASNVAANTKAQLVKKALGDYTRSKDGDHSVRDAAEKAWLESNKTTVDAAVLSGQSEARKAAFDAILDGSIADRARANGADPLSPFVEVVLVNAVRNHAAKTGQPIPQGADMTKAKRAVMESVGEDKVRAKAQQLLDASSF